jgi:putative hemolysin
VQIGITLVGVLTSAFGGKSLEAPVAAFLRTNLPWLAGENGSQAADIAAAGGVVAGDAAQAAIVAAADKVYGQWAFGIIVVLITFLSVLLGELIPKSLGLRDSATVATNTSVLMSRLAKCFAPVLWIMEKATKAVLWIFRKDDDDDTDLHREELVTLATKGVVDGKLSKEEGYIVREAMKFSDTLAEEVMIPKPKLVFIQKDDTHSDIFEKLQSTTLQVFPVYDENRDDILGLVDSRTLYGLAIKQSLEATNVALHDRKIRWEGIVHEVQAVPENQPLKTLYTQLLTHPLGAGVVVDEFGTVRGLVTLEDLMEELFGEKSGKSIPGSQPSAETPRSEELTTATPAQENAEAAPNIVRGVRVLSRNEENQPLVILADGDAEIDHIVENYFPDFQAEVAKHDEPFQSIAGFVMHYLEKLPEEGEKFTTGQFIIEVMDMDTLTIDKVQITWNPENSADAGEIASEG